MREREIREREMRERAMCWRRIVGPAPRPAVANKPIPTSTVRGLDAAGGRAGDAGDARGGAGGADPGAAGAERFALVRLGRRGGAAAGAPGRAGGDGGAGRAPPWASDILIHSGGSFLSSRAVVSVNIGPCPCIVSISLCLSVSVGLRDCAPSGASDLTEQAAWGQPRRSALSSVENVGPEAIHHREAIFWVVARLQGRVVEQCSVETSKQDACGQPRRSA
jgi:hypothetical protein